ncbi:SBBP repeat-containing protein [Chryseobacterium sp. R2A-55]|uniref:DUF7948 domain-containing protein n=1 Tax=Chryseobacterium sp. R2A-55 TaxID=2744445 RepID=UPI001F26E3FF|nr:SBBP repeat-containing protein [Chryseobacterium sp. R2A-55]
MKNTFFSLMALLVSAVLPANTETPNLANAKNSFENRKPAFEQNRGQLSGENSKQVKYFLKSRNMTFYLLNDGITYQFTKFKKLENEQLKSPEELIKNQKISKKVEAETFRMDMILKNTNPNLKITAENPENGITNYYNKNIVDVKRFSKIIYHDIYPNIDWVIYVNNQNVEYDFVIHPGGNPNQIKFKNSWADQMKINKDGSLRMNTKLGTITEKAPISFQNGKEIATKMVLKNDELSFKISSYDPKSTVTLDPEIYWSTYFGGSSDDFGTSCTVDSQNNVYLSGYTFSTTGIASGGYQNNLAGNCDAFLAKFSSSGTLIWSTYYGGNNEDKGKSCAVDANGNVYLAGETYSTTNIATSGAFQTSNNGLDDAFLAKFDSNGNLLWGTYFGGEYYDEGYSVAVDKNSGNVYLAGFAWSSTGITTPGAHQQNTGGATDAFLAKFDSNGNRQWSTYYGGEQWESGYCTVDNTGNVFLAGFTSSSVNIASSGAHQTNLGGLDDAYLVKFNSDGVRQWGTYYGGSDYDWGYFIATDFQGNVFLDGHTGSDANISTTGSYQASRSGSYDAFLAKFNGAGSRIWGTYYGGAEQERASACTVDNSDNVIVTGYTYSNDNIASPGAFQETWGGNQDVFVAKFYNDGSRIWGTYIGGTGDDFGAFSSTDSWGNVYITGNTNSSNNISSANAYQTSNNGGNDAFLTKLNPFGILKTAETNTYSVKIYPNPATDFIKVQHSKNEKISKVEIFDMEGKMVKNIPSLSQNTVDVKSLSAGMYLMKIYSATEVINTKFLKK